MSDVMVDVPGNGPVEATTCTGCGAPLLHSAMLCPTCTAPSPEAVRSDPWGEHRVGATYLQRIVMPERRPSARAVSHDLTSVAMILSLAVLGLTVGALFVPYATVDGVVRTLADDRSAALALLACSLVTCLGIVIARGPSGMGIGLMGGASMSVLFLFQRIAAGTIADGSSDVHWGTGFILFAFAAAAGLGVFLCALTGLRTGQRVTQVPVLVCIPALSLVVAALVIDREGLLDMAFGLGVTARALTAGALFLEGVLLVSAVGCRSRLGAGLLLGTALAPLVVAVDGAQPSRGLLSTAGMAEPSMVGAVGALVLLAGLLMALTAWPEGHPVRRRLTLTASRRFAEW